MAVARTAWQGTIMNTAPKYLAGFSDSTVRKRLILRLLKQKGRLKYKVGGDICHWNVKYMEPPVTAYGDGGNIDFSRHNLYQQLAIDWRGYKATDLMTEQERLQNSGDVQIINRYAQILPDLLDSLQNTFCSELYIDGYASGNENRLHGLQSFTGIGTVAAGDIIGQPSDTYGGLSTALANKGGSWDDTLTTQPNSTISTDWPSGTGDAQYDYISPKLMNWSSTGWGTGSTTWENNCTRVLRRTTSWLTLSGGMDGKPTIHLMDGDLFYGYKNKIEAKQRVIIPHKGADDLGFSDVLNQDGVMIQEDYDCPVQTFYSMNVNQMSLASQDSVLFGSRGPLYSIDNDAYKFMVGFFGNARYNPKHFAEGKGRA
jgi:hypothetical protein